MIFFLKLLGRSVSSTGEQRASNSLRNAALDLRQLLSYFCEVGTESTEAGCL